MKMNIDQTTTNNGIKCIYQTHSFHSVVNLSNNAINHILNVVNIRLLFWTVLTSNEV